MKIANASAGIAPVAIGDLERDLQDGIVLARIVELIGNKNMLFLTYLIFTKIHFSRNF